MRAEEIGLSPLKGDFLADPLQTSLLKQDQKPSLGKHLLLLKTCSAVIVVKM